MGCRDQLDWKQRLTDSQSQFRGRYGLQSRALRVQLALKGGESGPSTVTSDDEEQILADDLLVRSADEQVQHGERELYTTRVIYFKKFLK